MGNRDFMAADLENEDWVSTQKGKTVYPLDFLLPVLFSNIPVK